MFPSESAGERQPSFLIDHTLIYTREKKKINIMPGYQEGE